MSSYLSLLGVSTIDNVIGNNVNVQNVTTNSVTVSTLNAGLVSATSGGTLQNATPVAPLSYTSANNQLAIALTGSTGVTYDIVGNVGRFAFSPLTGATGPQGIQGFTGPVGALGPTGYTGPQGPPVPANSSSVGELFIPSTSTSLTLTLQNTFYQIIGWTVGTFNSGTSPSSTNSNIVINSAGIYQTLASISFSFGGNAHIYNFSFFINGVQVPGHQSVSQVSNANNVYSNVTLTGVVQMNAGDVVDLRARCTNAAGTTVTIQEANMNLCVQGGAIGPTGYTGPIYTSGTNINIAGNVISTVTNPQFERVLNSTLGNRTILLGSGSGSSFTTGGTDCVAVGNNTLNALTTGGTSTAVGSQALRYVTTGGSNTAVGFQALNALTTGSQNTAVGSFCGSSMTGGRFNTLMGMSAGYNITSGDTNFCLGLNSGYSITRSNDNISIGAYSMGKAANFMTGPDGRNVAIGHYSGHSFAGYPTNNVAIGYQSLWNATEVSDNIAIGTNSLATVRASGGGNIAIGGSSTSVGGTLTNGQGYNIGVGIASNLYLSANASNNIGIGGYSNFNTSTGINNISIGPFTQALSATGCNNIVLSTNGTISVPISGRGDNTAFIDSRSGLYYYNPAICYLYGTGLSNGRVQWATWDTGNVPTKGFYLTDYGNGANTVIVPNVYGHYEITINGAMLGNGSNLTLTFNNTNVRNYNVWYQSFSSNGIAYSLSATMIARPYTVVSLSGFEFQLTNMTLWGGLSLYVCIKFIGF